MYITRITYLNKKSEDLFFDTESEAIESMFTTVNNASKKYRNVSVIKDGTVLYIFNYVCRSLISDEGFVQLRKEFSEENERGLFFRVSDINAKSEQAVIRCLASNPYAHSARTIGLEMIEPAFKSKLLRFLQN